LNKNANIKNIKKENNLIGDMKVYQSNNLNNNNLFINNNSNQIDLNNKINIISENRNELFLKNTENIKIKIEKQRKDFAKKINFNNNYHTNSNGINIFSNFNGCEFEKIKKDKEELDKSQSLIEEKIKRIFNNSFCICKKNEDFKKLKKIIQKDLSIENILLVVNSHEIIKNILIEKKLIKSNVKMNYFAKVKIEETNTTNNQEGNIQEKGIIN